MILLKNIKENISYDAVNIMKFTLDDFFSRLTLNSGDPSGEPPEIVIEFEDRGGILCTCTINTSNCDNYVIFFNDRTYTYYDILKTPEIMDSVLEYYKTMYSIEELQ